MPAASGGRAARRARSRLPRAARESGSRPASADPTPLQRGRRSATVASCPGGPSPPRSSRSARFSFPGRGSERRTYSRRAPHTAGSSPPSPRRDSMPMPHHRYRPYETVDLPDRTWPSVVLARSPILVLDRFSRRQPGARQPDGPASEAAPLRPAPTSGLQGDRGRLSGGVEGGLRLRAGLVEDDLIPGGVTIAVLTPARPELIERTFEAVAGARRAIVHLYNSTSTTQRRVVFGLDQNGITSLAVRGAAMCKALAGGVTRRSCSSTRPRASTTRSSTTRSRSARRWPTEWGRRRPRR